MEVGYLLVKSLHFVKRTERILTEEVNILRKMRKLILMPSGVTTNMLEPLGIERMVLNGIRMLDPGTLHMKRENILNQ